MTGRSPSGRAGRPPAQAPAGLGDIATIPNADFLPVVKALESGDMSVGEVWGAAGIIRVLYEAAQDTAEALVLLRMGLGSDSHVVEVIDAHLAELMFALAKARGEQA